MNEYGYALCPECLTELVTRSLNVSREQRVACFIIFEELACMRGHIIGIEYMVPVDIDSLVAIAGYRNEAIRNAQGLPLSKWVDIQIETTRNVPIKPNLTMELDRAAIQDALNEELGPRWPAIEVSKEIMLKALQPIRIRKSAPKKEENGELVLLNPGRRRLK